MPPVSRANEASRMRVCLMGLLPTKHINTKGDATDNTVSDIASCENQIHPFFPHQKIGHLLKRSPPTAAIHKYQHRSRRVARIPQVMKAEVRDFCLFLFDFRGSKAVSVDDPGSIAAGNCILFSIIV